MKRWLLTASWLVLAGCDWTADPQAGRWGLSAISGLKTPADPPLTCGAQLTDVLADARQACAFRAGSLASESLGLDAAELAAIPIRHVIVVMKENRSFDHLLGRLSSSGQPGAEPLPASFSNPDALGQAVLMSHATTTCFPYDPGHQRASVLACIDGDRMDGFVANAAATTASNGHFVMSYYDSTDLPFYYWLATTYAVADRHFAAMASGTFANRNFLLFGTNAGVVDTGLVFAPPTTPSILQLLMNARYTWAVYTDDAPFSGALGWDATTPGVHPMQDLYDALDKGELPNVAFVDGRENVEDEHPTADLQVGEAWTKAIYDHAVMSPQWDRLALIWTYDEAGGFADHVPPEPLACAAEPGSPFTERGMRVPLVVVSPWAKRNYVSHVVRDHTAITRLIEALFGLPALTARDANSDALLDTFDFSCGRDLTVTAAPDAGTGLCPGR